MEQEQQLEGKKFPFLLTEMDASLITNALLELRLNANDSNIRTALLNNLKSDYEKSDIYKQRTQSNEKIERDKKAKAKK